MFERRLYYHIDWALVAAILALCAIGVVMIDATTADPTRGNSPFVVTQLTVLTLFILLTIVAVRKFRSEPIVRA